MIMALVAISCNPNESSTVREFIPGVYCRHFESPYSRGNDTLIISPMNDGSSYLIIHKSYFQKFRYNKLSDPEERIENWSAVYNVRDKILYEQKRDRMLSFVPDSNQLFVGGSAYYKIK